MEPEEFIDAGNQGHRGHSHEGDGSRQRRVESNDRTRIVYELRDCMIVRLDYYNNRKQALEAAGLEG